MKKQSGFTLIELMVVMAIIAILATAGLAAYTGYIKKARDTTRLADINAYNTIALGMLTATGTPPQTAKELFDAATTANNGLTLVDPQDWNKLCYKGAVSDMVCSYSYRLCDGATGFAIGARFESTSNTAMYSTDEITVGAWAAGWSSITTGHLDADIFEIGSCTTHCTSGTGGCPATILINPVKLNTTAAPGDALPIT